jgi:hypothetical protein
MPQYFKEHGERLVELGYRILPLPPGSKGPRLKDWPHAHLSAADVRRMAANGSAQAGIGVIAATTPAIDVDILDPEVAERMSQEIDRIFAGQSLMTRTGRAPKFLIPFRSDEPFRKLSSGVYTDGKHEHHVEVLGDGQQWVAYHLHPATNKPYEWWNGLDAEGIVGLEADQLPVLTRVDAQRVIDAFEVLAADRVASGLWSVRVAVVSTERTGSTDDDPFDAQPVGKTESEVAALLKRHPNDGASYDHWFRVLCGVHHELGDAGRELAYAWSAACAKHSDEKFDKTWASLGSYKGRMSTLRSVMAGAAKELPNSGARPEAARPWQVFPDDEFSFDFHTEWLIDDVLPQADLAVIYGASGSGKTFFVLDMVAAVARGVRWRENETKQSGVVYISAEGAGGFRTRVAAYRKHHEIAGPLFGVMPAAPNLLFDDDVAGVVSEIRAFGTVGLVVIDTLAATMPGGEENSGKDMGRAVANCKLIAQQTGAMVVLIHHSGKDEAKGARGWSGLRAAADVEIEITRDEDSRGARVTKQKDGEDGNPFAFRLQVVPLGFRATGKEITSCVVVDNEEMPGKVKPRAGGAVQRLVSDIYADKAPLGGEGLTIEELVQEVLAADPGKRGANIRRAISDMLKRDFFVMKADKLVYF